MTPIGDTGEAVEEFLHITETGETCVTEIKTNQLSKPNISAEPLLIIHSPPRTSSMNRDSHLCPGTSGLRLLRTTSSRWDRTSLLTPLSLSSCRPPWAKKDSPTTPTLLKVIKTEPSDDEQYVSSQAKGPSCPICVNRHFRGINKLVRHMRSHTQEKPYTCLICHVGFSQTYHLLRHMRRQHNAGEHVCSLCGITFESAMDLQEHKSCTRPKPCHARSAQRYAPVRTRSQATSRHTAKSHPVRRS
uniref:C2H2-type domain-containing protein n=1 Tax=Neogobius melanostomus TaxID=47308 RepID=A0A8C6V4U4_9GOBI